MAMDATGFPWERLPAPTLVSGNLPFNVATRLIEALLPHWENVPRAAFMVQKEVAERLAAGPGDAAYGSFSVIVSSAAQVSLLGTLKPGCFRPAPKVSAAFVGLQLGKPLLPKGEMPAFHRFVRQCFAQRRKTLRNSLSAALGREASGALLAAAGLDSRSRAGELDLKMFVHLFRYLGQMNK
jgi:16S rRNA (adenine1518-N6/adenine1519-N6)-dimethyltransferase